MTKDGCPRQLFGQKQLNSKNCIKGTSNVIWLAEGSSKILICTFLIHWGGVLRITGVHERGLLSVVLPLREVIICVWIFLPTQIAQVRQLIVDLFQGDRWCVEGRLLTFFLDQRNASSFPRLLSIVTVVMLFFRHVWCFLSPNSGVSRMKVFEDNGYCCSSVHLTKIRLILQTWSTSAVAILFL